MKIANRPEASLASVTVIIPTYNDAHFLPQAIQSVLSQTSPPTEIIVVDDGSTDETGVILLRDYKDLVKAVRQNNQGLSAARNTGLRLAGGEYVTFLDADDRLLPHHLEVSLNALVPRKGTALTCGDIRLFGDCGDFVHRHQCAPSPDHFATLLRGCFMVNVAACLFRRSVVDSLGGFDEQLGGCEDWDLFLRIARHFPIYCHHEQVMEYHRRAGQLSSDPCRMFTSAVQVLASQRKNIRSNAEYCNAYREGLDSVRSFYGNAAYKELPKVFARSGMVECCKLASKLIRWHPGGLRRLLLK
jgi:glycosyltransferase involved in cell wall biosynthesis